MLAFRSVQQGNHCAREEFLHELKAGPPARQRHDAHRGTGLTHTAPQYSHSMAIPALTHRSFWTRLVVFGVSVLLYAWVVRLMTQEHSIIGTKAYLVGPRWGRSRPQTTGAPRTTTGSPREQGGG